MFEKNVAGRRGSDGLALIDDALELASLLKPAWSQFDTGPVVCEGDEEDERSLLEQLAEKRSTALAELGTFVEERQAERTTFEERDASDKDEDKPSDEERSAHIAAEESFNEEFNKRKAKVAELDRRIDEQELLERRREDAAKASRREASVKSEPATYRADNAHEVSYFRDLAYTDDKAAQALPGNASEARERLQRHGKETETWLQRRAQERERRAEEEVDRAEREFWRSHGQSARGFDASPFERRVNPNRADGQGGYFVPPLWLIEEYIPALRAGRVAADLCRQMPLPQGTDSINIPKVSTPTQVAPQNVDGGAVASRDLTDTFVQANVKTVAGQEDVPIQLLDQSPGNGRILDQVIAEDLLADYNLVVDQQVIKGTGANAAANNGGQIMGIYPSNNWGANTRTWTSASPRGVAFNQLLGAMASKTAGTRFDLSSFAFLLHQSRWFWYATELDGASGTSGRPLVNPRDTGMNVSAIAGDSPPQGYAGQALFGPNIHISDNVPITDASGVPGAGSADVAIGAKWDDLWLFEGDLRTRVLTEVLSGTLEVRYQVYNYVAFLARYGPSITIASGTGFAAPASAIDSSIAFR